MPRTQGQTKLGDKGSTEPENTCCGDDQNTFLEPELRSRHKICDSLNDMDTVRELEAHDDDTDQAGGAEDCHAVDFLQVDADDLNLESQRSLDQDPFDESHDCVRHRDMACRFRSKVEFFRHENEKVGQRTREVGGCHYQADEVQTEGEAVQEEDGRPALVRLGEKNHSYQEDQ